MLNEKSCVPDIAPWEDDFDDFDEKAHTVEKTFLSLAAVIAAIRAAVKIFKAAKER